MADSGRIHYIDWLRVLAVLLLFPFHTSRVFNPSDPFYIKAGLAAPPINFALAFVDRWHMPLLFLLAGASTFLALRKRDTRQYISERAKRLLIPFGFGLLLIIPPQTFIGAGFNSGYKGSFLGYVASGDFLAWNIRDGGDYYGGFGIGHLWFVLWLFAVSLLALPLVAWARGDRGRAWTVRWAQRLSAPVWWLLPPLLIWIGDALPDVAGKNPFYFLVFFVLGFIALADPAFAEQSERLRWPALIGGLVLVAAYVGTGTFRNALPDPSFALFAVNYLGFLGTWLTIVGVLGLGRRYLDRPSPALSYLAEASYPIYILHQTVIVVLATALLTLPLVWPVKWVILLVAGVAGTFGLYEVARRFAPTRFMLGMRRRAA